MNWRGLIENSAIGAAGSASGGLVFGDPAIEAEIVKVETGFDVSFPQEFRDIYLEFNGVGPRYSDDEIAWWLLPLDQIPDFNREFQEAWFDDKRSELIAKRLVVFGSWFNGDVFGYLRNVDGAIHSPQIYQYQHEEGCIDDWDEPLERFLKES